MNKSLKIYHHFLNVFAKQINIFTLAKNCVLLFSYYSHETVMFNSGANNRRLFLNLVQLSLGKKVINDLNHL